MVHRTGVCMHLRTTKETKACPFVGSVAFEEDAVGQCLAALGAREERSDPLIEYLWQCNCC